MKVEVRISKLWHIKNVDLDYMNKSKKFKNKLNENEVCWIIYKNLMVN